MKWVRTIKGRSRDETHAQERRTFGAAPLSVLGSTVLGSMLGACLLAGCGQSEAPASAAPSAVEAAPALNIVRIPPDSPQIKEIRVEPVRLASMPSDEVVAPARVAINPNLISRVLSPVSGRIVKILVKFGDHVEKGQLLLTMDSADADAAVSTYLQAESTERQTKIALQKAETDLGRASDLYQHRAIAEKDLLGAQNDLATAKSAYEIAQFTREQARRKLEVLQLKPTEFRQVVEVRAPINGQVLEVNVAPGEYRAAISFHTDTTAPLMSIADLSTVWVSADVPEPLFRLVHVGEPVAISLVSFPDEVLSGRVARIGDVLDAQARTLKVYIDLPNPHGRFRPEMYGTISLAGPARSTPVVPNSSVIQEYGRSVVFLERGPGQFERRPVTTGVRMGDRVAIVAGLEPGDRVIVDGAILLKGQ